MATRRRKVKHGNKFESSVASKTFIYNDNLSKDVIRSFKSTASAENIILCNAEVLGLPKNVSDPDFFHVLSSSIKTEPNAGAIVLTTDLASKDKGMTTAISQYENDNICTIKFSDSLRKDKELPIIAKDALFSTKGFRILHEVYQRYIEIFLSKSKRNLIIRAKEKNGKTKCKAINNIFKK